MTTSSLGHKAVKGAIWATIDRLGSMGLVFIVNMILAHLLLPVDFGAIGMITIFMAVSQTLIDGGFSSALIQKKFPTDKDYSTIFYWNIVLALVLYGVLFISSPTIAQFYRMPILCDVLRVVGLTLISGSIISLQITKLRKALAFKTIAITNLISYIIGGGISIIFALNGWGVWSLVALQIFTGVFTIVVYGIITRWLPLLFFSKQSLKELFNFGGFILAANVMQTVCQNFQGILIGRKFSATQMGYYSQAYKLDQVTSYSLPQIIVQVMYPVYSSIQDDRERLISILGMNIRVISFCIFPLLCILIIISRQLILLLYGQNWVESVQYFQILCVGGLFVCLQNVNFYAVAALGKSKQLFFWSFYKWGFLLVALIIGSCFGMKGVLWGMVASSLNLYLVNSSLVSKFVGLSLFCQIRMISPALVLSTAVGAFMYVVNQQMSNMFLLVIIYIAIYIFISYCLRLKGLLDTMVLFNRLKQKV